MARAQFNRKEVVDNLISLFWANGFSASSMQQVVKATGLKPGSLYLSFGNKEALFREALEGYAEKGIAKIKVTLEKAPTVGHGICKILEGMVLESTSKNYCSCFLVKTQLELSSNDNVFHKFASEKLEEIESIYRDYLEKEYSSETSKNRAASLMLNIFGMRVYGYQQGSANMLRKGLREGLPWLPWMKNL